MGVQGSTESRPTEYESKETGVPAISAKPGSTNLSTHHANRPEIVREVRVCRVGVRQCEIALHPPRGSPGISNDEPLLLIVITDGKDRMAANFPFLRSRHGCHAGPGHSRAFEAFVNRDPEHERVAGSQAPFQLVRCGTQPLIGHRLVFHRVQVTFAGRFIAEFYNVV